MKHFLGTLTAGLFLTVIAVAIMRGEWAVLFVLAYMLSRAATAACPEPGEKPV